MVGALMIQMHNGVPIREVDEINTSSSVWFVDWGASKVTLNPSWWARARFRVGGAWAVLRGRKRAYSNEDIVDMLGDDE